MKRQVAWELAYVRFPKFHKSLIKRVPKFIRYQVISFNK